MYIAVLCSLMNKSNLITFLNIKKKFDVLPWMGGL